MNATTSAHAIHKTKNDGGKKELWKKEMKLNSLKQNLQKWVKHKHTLAYWFTHTVSKTIWRRKCAAMDVTHYINLSRCFRRTHRRRLSLSHIFECGLIIYYIVKVNKTFFVLWRSIRRYVRTHNWVKCVQTSDCSDGEPLSRKPFWWNPASLVSQHSYGEYPSTALHLARIMPFRILQRAHRVHCNVDTDWDKLNRIQHIYFDIFFFFQKLRSASGCKWSLLSCTISSSRNK